jgi:cytochrome c biogenesis protein CcmG/thiol:disulfide interchange protein DsbE
MANRQRAEARRKAAAKAARSQEGGSKTLLFVVLGVAAVIAVVVGVIAASGGDDSTATDTTGSSVLTLPDSQPVTVEGDTLATYDPAVTDDPAIGATAPRLSGLNFNGQPIEINADDGAYMVVFLAHWCPHCNNEVPRLLDWKHSGQVPADLRVIGVGTAVDPNADYYPPADWFANKGWEWPVMVDESLGARTAGKAAAAFGASGWPYLVIVGADGTVKARVSGEVEIADLQKIVDDALTS